MMIRNIVFLCVAILVLASCGTTQSSMTKEQAYGLMYQNHPQAIAAMPPVNKTNNVEAKEFFYSSFTRPLAERGYYVLPAFLTMELFKSESAYDSEMFIDGSLKQFGEVLGADALLFTIIHRWEKAALNANITVEVEYILKSTKDNATLFSRRGTIVHDMSTDNTAGGLAGLISMAADMLTTATTNPIKAARAANMYTLSDLPAGMYHSGYETDKTTNAGQPEFSVTIKQ